MYSVLFFSTGLSSLRKFSQGPRNSDAPTHVLVSHVSERMNWKKKEKNSPWEQETEKMKQNEDRVCWDTSNKQSCAGTDSYSVHLLLFTQQTQHNETPRGYVSACLSFSTTKAVLIFMQHTNTCLTSLN